MVRKNGGGLKAAKQRLKGVRALVIGLASTGISAARFLNDCGAAVTANDSKPEKDLVKAKEELGGGILLKAGGHGGIDTSNFDLVVVSPGVPCDIPLLNEARRNGAEVISDIELAYRFIDAPVIAVAGTNGKTTTTTLLGKVLKDAGKKVFVGGNIGTPAVEYVANDMRADACVLEISSFHLETTDTFNPHMGILLNITEDHLDRYKDFGHYAETKFRLFENQSEEDWAIVNVGDPVIAGKVKAGITRGRVIPFTSWGRLDYGLYLKGGDIVSNIDGIELYPTSKIRLRGIHNHENVMSVIAAARVFGVSAEAIRKTLESFEGLSHRMELVGEKDGVAYIDDSKGTNIGSLMMALRGIKGPVVLIAGGRDKGGDYSVLGPLVKEKVKLIVLIGEARFKIKESLGSLTETVVAETFEEAVRVCRERATAGDTVLLCPACSSFDMFKSYKERGERFKALVEAL